MDLPKNDSPDLHLVVATPEELLAQQNANSDEWRGALPLGAYLRREDYLLDQVLTKDGGLTPWMLVYQHPDPKQPRQVLCGCESIKKKALLARKGKVEDVVAHGVASVFCPPKCRGKGYAGRMMRELGKRLRDWQVVDGSQSAFSVLFSDIGKRFYATYGWQPFPSAHVSLPAKSLVQTDLPTVRQLKSVELDDLCAIDEKLLHRHLLKTADSERTTVALVPDLATLQWHHAREDFVSNELHGGRSLQGRRGAIVEEYPGARVWCYWTRVWTNPQEHVPNTLHILRLVVEDDDSSDSAPAKTSTTVKAIAALLGAAQLEAHASGMQEVQLWNPSAATLSAARMLEPTAELVQREKESIASLQWYGDGSWKDVDWVCNEKYGWC